MKWSSLYSFQQFFENHKWDGYTGLTGVMRHVLIQFSLRTEFGEFFVHELEPLFSRLDVLDVAFRPALAVSIFRSFSWSVGQ